MFKTVTRHLSHRAGGRERGLERKDAVHLEKRIRQHDLAVLCSVWSWLLRVQLCSGLERKPDHGHIPGHPKEEKARGKTWQQSLWPPLPFQLSLSASGQLPVNRGCLPAWSSASLCSEKHGFLLLTPLPSLLLKVRVQVSKGEEPLSL